MPLHVVAIGVVGAAFHTIRSPPLATSWATWAPLPALPFPQFGSIQRSLLDNCMSVQQPRLARFCIPSGMAAAGRIPSATSCATS